MLSLLVRLQLPLVAGIGVCAPLILELFGRAYSDESTAVLRLLVLGVLPHGVNALCLALARVRRQLRAVVAIQAAQAGLFVVLAVPLLPAVGIAGVGIAFLASQSVVALIASVTLIRPLLIAGRQQPPKNPETARVIEDARPGSVLEEDAHEVSSARDEVS